MGAVGAEPDDGGVDPDSMCPGRQGRPPTGWSTRFAPSQEASVRFDARWLSSCSPAATPTTARQSFSETRIGRCSGSQALAAVEHERPSTFSPRLLLLRLNAGAGCFFEGLKPSRSLLGASRIMLLTEEEAAGFSNQLWLTVAIAMGPPATRPVVPVCDRLSVGPCRPLRFATKCSLRWLFAIAWNRGKPQ